MTADHDDSWTRALMASSGIALGAGKQQTHPTSDEHEASAADTPLARLQRLAAHKDVSVRAAVARRHDCPIGLLAALAHDRAAEVRCAVAGNPRVVQAVAEHLAADRDAEVLKSLARNDRLPMSVLQRLALHRREEVRHVASRQLDARLHGQDATTINTAAAAELAGYQEPRQAAIAPELRDRVAPAPQWIPGSA